MALACCCHHPSLLQAEIINIYAESIQIDGQVKATRYSCADAIDHRRRCIEMRWDSGFLPPESNYSLVLSSGRPTFAPLHVCALDWIGPAILWWRLFLQVPVQRFRKAVQRRVVLSLHARAPSTWMAWYVAHEITNAWWWGHATVLGDWMLYRRFVAWRKCSAERGVYHSLRAMSAHTHTHTHTHTSPDILLWAWLFVR